MISCVRCGFECRYLRNADGLCRACVAADRYELRSLVGWLLFALLCFGVAFAL